MKITKDMIIADILEKKPEAGGILIENGLGCLGCPSSQVETLVDAAEIHGMDIEKLLSELNK